MAVEIRILSGARSGEQIVLDADEFRVGTDPGCEIFFDPQADPAAKDRSALLQLTGEGWLVRSTGAGEVLVNQEPVRKEARIRSGDLVRLSDLGPDFLFVISGRGSGAVAKAKSDGTPATARGKAADTPGAKGTESPSRPAAPPHPDPLPPGEREVGRPAGNGLPRPGDLRSGVEVGSGDPRQARKGDLRSDVSAGSEDPRRARFRPILWAGEGLAAIALLVALAWYMGRDLPKDGFGLDFATASGKTTEEGARLAFRMALKTSGRLRGQLAFSLVGQAPAGARIDRTSGEFTWTPAEDQGPGKYPVSVRATARDTVELTAESTFWIEVREVNSPPVIRPAGEKTMDAGTELAVPLAADDPDQPPNRQTFRLASGPEWASIDSLTGLLRCRPPATVDGAFDATVRVADDGQPPLEDEAVVKLVVRADPQARAQAELREAVYLVQVEVTEPNRTDSWPFCTCAAIDEHTLLSTAREVWQLAEWRRQGRRIWATCPATGLRAAVEDLKVHRGFVPLMDKPGDWIYANLGLLVTTEALPKSVRLVPSGELGEVDEGAPVGCFGFSHDGSKITRHDAFAPQWHPGKIFGISSLPDLAGGAPVLELKAKIPQNVYGSPIVDRQGRVIGVYGEAAPAQDIGLKDLHYATAVDSELLKSWTERRESDWVSPAPIAGSSAGPERTTP